MLFPAFAQSVSEFFRAVIPLTGAPLAFIIAFIDQETGSIFSAVFAFTSDISTFAVFIAAVIAGWIRNTILYELANRAIAHLGDDPQLIQQKLQSKLHSKPFFWITGLQCCFAFRWTLPVLCAQLGIRRPSFYAASFFGVALWTGILHVATRFWLQLCYPGLLGQSEAAKATPGLIIATIVAVITVKAASRRWTERLRIKKNQH